jgi:hypothetical protein
MKLRDLEQHLRKQGCIFFREGGAHSVWLNPSNRKIARCPATAKSRKERSVAFAGNLKSRSRRYRIASDLVVESSPSPLTNRDLAIVGRKRDVTRQRGRLAGSLPSAGGRTP